MGQRFNVGDRVIFRDLFNLKHDVTIVGLVGKGIAITFPYGGNDGSGRVCWGLNAPGFFSLYGRGGRSLIKHYPGGKEEPFTDEEMKDIFV